MHTIPKNTTKGYTEGWKKERARLTEFYQSTPFYGAPTSKSLYESAKKIIPSLIQASHCGPIVQLTTYKQDEGKAVEILVSMFKQPIKRTVCPYTNYVTTFVINK